MKLTEKELNEFPIGTKIYIDYKYPYIKNEHDSWVCFVNDTTRGYWNENVLKQEIKKVEIPTYTEYIPPKPILDDKEKEYLSSLVKPFKSKVKYIIKEKLYCNNSKSKEYIAIACFDSIDSFEMPLFKSNTMYKGMELDRKYTLEDLRLIVDEKTQI